MEFAKKTEEKGIGFSYTVQAGEALERTAQVEVDATAVEAEYESKLKATMRKVKLPGFRQGKVPQKVIESRFGEGLRAEALEEVIREVYPMIIEAENNVAGVLRVEPLLDEEGKFVHTDEVWQFTLVYESDPDVVIKKVKNLAAIAPDPAVTDADVRQMIERLQIERATFEDKDVVIAKGDYVDIEYRIREDGEERDDKPRHFFWPIGENGIDDAIDKALIGAKTGDDQVLTITFSDDHKNRDFAGRTLEFEIKVTRVADRILPEVNDDFAKSLGEFATVADLEKEIRSGLEQRYQQESDEAIRRTLLTELRESNPVELPASYVERLQRNKAGRMVETMKKQGMVQGSNEKEMLPYIWQAVRGEAEADGQVYYLLGKIADDQGFDVAPEELEEELGRMAGGYQIDLPRLRQELGSEGIDQVRDGMRNEKAVQFVKEHATIELVSREKWAEMQAETEQPG